MRYLKPTLVLLLIAISTLNAQRFSIPDGTALSSEAELSVLTCGPGKDLYSSFGHSAFRLKDPTSGLDIVYNYGTFDFSTPNFYSKFVLGKLPYMLSISRYRNFQYVYYREGRSIEEQHLNLSNIQLKKVVAYLYENNKEANKYYLYDFFDDNCATKLIEVLEKSLETSDLEIQDALEYENLTFRTMVRSELTEQPWSKWGIDLALGSLIDKPLRELQDSFLPKVLAKDLKLSRIGSKPLITTERTLLRQVFVPERAKKILSPIAVFTFISILGLILLLFSTKKASYFFKINDLVLGIIGLVLIFMMLFTDHYYVKWNWNILWANPIWIIFLLKKSSKSIPWILLVSLLFSLALDVFKIQILPEGIAFMIYLMLLRLVFNLKNDYKKDRIASS